MKTTQEKLPPVELFNYLMMFNHVVTIDEELAAQLPTTEFEVSFNRMGDIYVNRVPLGVNVKQRYDALGGKPVQQG
jgi:hypothetical protein